MDARGRGRDGSRDARMLRRTRAMAARAGECDALCRSLRAEVARLRGAPASVEELDAWVGSLRDAQGDDAEVRRILAPRRQCPP